MQVVCEEAAYRALCVSGSRGGEATDVGTDQEIQDRHCARMGFLPTEAGRTSTGLQVDRRTAFERQHE